MRKLLIYKHGEYVTGGMISIRPNKEPLEEYDLSDLTNSEFNSLRRNPKDKQIRKKIKTLKNG